MTTLSLEDAARDAGGREALVVGARVLTFAELRDRASRATAWLSRQGVAPTAEGPVALVLRTDLAEVELFWALFGLGRPLLLLHPRHSDHERQALLKRTGALLVDAAAWAAVRASFTEHENVAARPDPNAARVIVPTSGSSGRPKLSMLSERALSAAAQASFANLGVMEHDRWLACLPLAHVGGLSILTRMLAARRAAVLFEGDGGLLGRLDELERPLEGARITLLSLVPTVLDALLGRGFSLDPRLRAVLLGGAAAAPSLLERAQRSALPLLTTYGLTEAASQVTTRRYAERLAPFEAGSVHSGPALPGVELRLGDDSVIEVRGPNLHNGYWDDDDSRTSDGFLRTFDRGALSARGELSVYGRCDDVIITGGENVDPLAVEAVLLGLPGARGACVFGLENPRWGEVVAAALSFSESPPSLEALSRFCAEKLAPYQRPRLVALLSALPETASGKLDRRAVAQAAAAVLVPLPGVNLSG